MRVRALLFPVHDSSVHIIKLSFGFGRASGKKTRDLQFANANCTEPITHSSDATPRRKNPLAYEWKMNAQSEKWLRAFRILFLWRGVARLGFSEISR